MLSNQVASITLNTKKFCIGSATHRTELLPTENVFGVIINGISSIYLSLCVISLHMTDMNPSHEPGRSCTDTRQRLHHCAAPKQMSQWNLWQAVAQNCHKSTGRLNICNLAWPKLAQRPIKLTVVMMSFWQMQCISFSWEVLQAGSAALADTMWNTFDGRYTADALLSMLNAQGSTELDRIKTKNKTLKSVTEPVRLINMDRSKCVLFFDRTTKFWGHKRHFSVALSVNN